MKWTSSKDLVDKLHRKWQRGLFLRGYLENDSIFPLRLAIKHPNAGELADSFAEAGEWLQKLEDAAKAKKGKGYELEYRTVNYRLSGRQEMPVAAIFNRENDALGVIGKIGEAERFKRISGEIIAVCPQLIPWLRKRPLKVLEHQDEWPRLLAIISFLEQTPRPGIYLRQLDIAGVDTKFIEKRRRLLSELLDMALPPENINHKARGAANFEERYGFTAKPVQIRFRILDVDLYIKGLTDLQVSADEFARLNLAVERVFITENMINGLAFPDFPKSLVIFGLGYGLHCLVAAKWLKDKEIIYWGDLDSHGFAMLDQIRSYFPQTKSLLMDRATLLAHRQQWGREESQTNKKLLRLDKAEHQLYKDIIENNLANALRLEQERISYKFLKAALSRIAQNTF